VADREKYIKNGVNPEFGDEKKEATKRKGLIGCRRLNMPLLTTTKSAVFFQ
jgi:hypothetical protein